MGTYADKLAPMAAIVIIMQENILLKLKGNVQVLQLLIRIREPN